MCPEVVDAVAKVPFVAVMATHEGPELDRAHVVLPAATWAESDGTLHQLPAAGAAAEGGGAGARRRRSRAGSSPRASSSGSERPLGATTAREVFVLLAKATPDYAGLDYRGLGAADTPLPLAGDAAETAQEARA